MNTYNVSFPIAGTITYRVKADDEATASAAAWAEYEDSVGPTPSPQWDAFDCLMEGNVQQYDQNETEVTLVKLDAG
jgi:hypothetical protein